MPRPKAAAHASLIERAMARFWLHGYSATSMDAIVEATEVSRHGIYAAHGGKQDLFIACMRAYQALVVTPAFAVVETEHSDLESIRNYFEHQIARAEASGFPGPGCLVTNTTTELGPHDDAVLAEVQAHHQRLRNGFSRALTNEAHRRGKRVGSEVDALADFLVVATQGLWSMSRAVDDARPLRAFVETTLSLIETRLSK